MNNRREVFPILLSLGMLILIAGIPIKAEAQASKKMNILLAGYKISPKVPTDASGMVTITITKDSLTVEGSFSDLSAPYLSGGIFYTQEGRAVNQLFRFDVELNEQKTGGTFRVAQNRFSISEGHRELLKEGDLTVKIMSTQNKHGEIGAGIPPVSVTSSGAN